MTGPVIEHALPDRFRADAARLYFAAFWPKLSRILGRDNIDRVAELAAPRLRADRAITAHDGATLLGIAGFKSDGAGLVDLTLADLRQIYGFWGGIWRGVALSLLGRSESRDELLMDGICVTEAARGRGVGTLLLDAVEATARTRGATHIRMDVIDTNPRARDLYLRRGFVPVRSVRLGPLASLFGFSAATEMHKTLGSPS
jgi:GNAT superfamily N-acetyltransferase